MGKHFNIRNLMEYVSTVLNSMSIGLMFLVALWIGADVVGRGLFNQPIHSTPEIVKTATVCVAFLGLVYTLRQGRHVRADMVVRRLPKGVRQGLNMMANILGVFVFAILTRYSWNQAWTGFLEGEWEGYIVEVPIYPARFVIVLLASLLCIQFFLYFIGDIRELVTQGRQR